MLLLSKSVAQLLLPPGGLILLGLLGLLCWRRGWGRALIVLSLVGFWLLSIEPVRDVLALSLEMRYPPLTQQQLPKERTAIVLMGGGIYENAPEYGGRDELGRYAMMRTVYAADLARTSELPVYASGGASLADGAEPEGSVMRRWLIRLGVSPERIHAETSAANSWQNALYLKKMLAVRGINRVVLVTSAWHMPRAVWSFRQQGLQVIPAPCDYLSEREPYDIRSYLPRWNVLSDSGQALHEYLGLLWYRLRYG